MSTESSASPRTSWPIFVLPAIAFLAGVAVMRSRSGSAVAPPPPAPAGAPAPAPTPAPATPAPAPASAAWVSPILPIPEGAELDPAKVALGRRLFHDSRLSKDGTIACSSCHDLGSGGDDGRVVSVGVGGAHGSINAPTVLNSSLNFRQFWDGRAETLEDQIDGPIQHPAEMAMEWDELLAKTEADAEYAAAFRKSYGGPATRASFRDAIATFERSLVTPDSPFDRYLKGEASALSAEAVQGYELFVKLGCSTCHQGVNAGGNMFQRLGQMEDYFALRGGELTSADLGRFNVTGNELDRSTFKVPSLRNVELTAPYFHDGSIATLEEAVQVMARVQLGEDLAADEVRVMVAFLRSLTGRQPADG